MPTVLFLAFVVAGSTFAWALLRSQAGMAVVPTSRPTGLALLGDSLAVGLGSHCRLWAAAQHLPYFQDAAVGRFTSQQGVDGVQPGSIVLVSLGTNDATSRTGANALPAFAAALRARGPRAILWLVPPATKALPGLEVVRAMIRSLPGVLAVGTTAAVRSDGLHPSSYAAVFADVAAVLEQVR